MRMQGAKSQELNQVSISRGHLPRDVTAAAIFFVVLFVPDTRKN